MIKQIPLHSGLVTSRPASMLEEGELTVANDSRYRPSSPTLWRAWGRTRYITSDGQIGGAGGKVVGLAYCPFEPNADGSSDDFLIAHKADKYYSSVFTARTGTISATTIDGVGTGTHLDVCHANNKWYLFNGNSEGVANRVLKPATTNPVSRRHGLVPVPITPTSPSVTTSAGSWPQDEVFWGEGRFFFFTTEVVRPGDPDELESAAAIGTPPHVDLQKDPDGGIDLNVTVTRHDPLANSDATEIRVYMIKASLNQTWDNSLLARAFRVGTISVSATAANDKIVLSGNYTFYDPTLTPTVTTVSGTISNPSNAAAIDNAVATVLANNSATIDLTNWGFAVPAGSAILGMKMFIRFRSPGTGLAAINATFRTGAGPTLGILKAFSTGSDDFVLHQQPFPNSETDTWGLTLVGTDVNSSNFGVRLVITAAGAASAQIDGVEIRLYTATLPTIGPAYPIIAIQEGNVLTVHHANMPPPVSGTGDVIDGALVVDNISNRRELAYSLPGKYDYFPSIYRIGLDLKEHDQVTVVRKLGDIGLIFCYHAIVRLNHVPYSTDPEFISGRAYETIVADHGCVSRQGVTVFAVPGGPTLAGYVSHNGIYMNDGARDRIMTEDIDFASIVDVTQLSKAVLLNYPKEHVLKFEFVLAGSGATENNRYLLIHYHPSHRKPNGNFKITGPNVMRASCGTIAKLDAETVLILGHPTDARLYVEDNSVSDAEGTGINMLFETREIYPNGEGQEVTVVRSWYHQTGGASGMTATSTPRFRNTGEALTDHTALTFTPNPEGLVLLQHHFGTVEAVRWRLSLPDAGASNAAIGFNYAMHDLNTHGTALDN